MKILITGAGSGIGFLSALVLAKRGHKVYLTCHKEKEVKVIKQKLKSKKNIEVLKLDATDEADIKKVLSLNIDVLYSNAAMAYSGSILEADMNKVEECFDVNVISNFKLVKLILRQMVDKNKGRIILTSSIAGIISVPFLGIYSATKASITMIGKALQKELSLIGTNVKVAIIEPGLYHTGFNQVLIDSKYDNGKYFRDIKNELYNIEHALFKLGEKKELDSIVVKVVRAIEDKNVKSVYRAPIFYNILTRLYGVFRK